MWLDNRRQIAVLNYRLIPSNELEAKSTTPLAGRVITPTRPLPTPEEQRTTITIINMLSSPMY